MTGVCSQRDIVTVSNEELLSNQVPVALLAEEEQEEEEGDGHSFQKRRGTTS